MLRDPEVVELITETAAVLQKAVNSGIVYKIPELMKEALSRDVFFFAGMKTYAQMAEASTKLLDADGKLKPVGTFIRDVKKVDEKYNENYLRAERNFAVGSAQNASKWQKFEKEKEGYDLKYLTDNGPNVRESHRALEGTTLPVDDPFWNSYLPKNGWNCHCFVLQVRKGTVPVSDSEEATKLGEAATTSLDKDGKNKSEIFRFNAGKEMKVFPPGHPLLNPNNRKQAMAEIEKVYADKKKSNK